MADKGGQELVERELVGQGWAWLVGRIVGGIGGS